MSLFTKENLKMLARAERDMDDGTVPFVVVEGVGRTLCDPEIFKKLELRQGQTISLTLFGEILKLNLEQLEKKQAAEQDRVIAYYEDEMSNRGESRE